MLGVPIEQKVALSTGNSWLQIFQNSDRVEANDPAAEDVQSGVTPRQEQWTMHSHLNYRLMKFLFESEQNYKAKVIRSAAE